MIKHGAIWVLHMIERARHQGLWASPLKWLAPILAATLLAACGETAKTQQPVATAVTKPAGPIAFEPITGLPDSRAAELAAALGQRAVGNDLIVVSKGDPKLRYRVKGYFAAESSAERTTVSYIWDVFDKDNQRVHRFDGITYAPSSGASDPWGAVTPEAIDSIANATTSELSRFLSIIGAQTARGPAPSIATAFAATVAQRRTNTPRYFIGNIESNIADAQTALPQALAQALVSQGAALASSRDNADLFVTAETAMTPAEKGRQMVAIIWTLKRANGNTIGSVRQVSRILDNTLDHGWGPAAASAAAAAGPALIELVRGS